MCGWGLLCARAAASICSCPLFPQTSQSASITPSDEVILRIIVVSSAEQAQHVLALLKQGEDFAVLAKKQSIDSTSDEGGPMGKVSLSMLRPELRDAVRGLS